MISWKEVLHSWTAGLVVQPDLSGVEKRLDSIDQQLRRASQPRPPVRWWLCVPLTLMLAASVWGLLASADLATSSTQNLSKESTKAERVLHLQQQAGFQEEESIHLDLQSNEFVALGTLGTSVAQQQGEGELQTIQGLQGALANAQRQEEASSAALNKSQATAKNASAAYTQLVALQKSGDAFADQRWSLILASICSVVIGGILSYVLMGAADWTRRRRLP